MLLCSTCRKEVCAKALGSSPLQLPGMLHKAFPEKTQSLVEIQALEIPEKPQRRMPEPSVPFPMRELLSPHLSAHDEQGPHRGPTLVKRGSCVWGLPGQVQVREVPPKREASPSRRHPAPEDKSPQGQGLAHTQPWEPWPTCCLPGLSLPSWAWEPPATPSCPAASGRPSRLSAPSACSTPFAMW